MKRYIRLKDNRIVDTERYEIDKHLVRIIRFYDKLKKKDFEIFIEDIIAESDDIADLIMVGDLVKFGGKDSHSFVYSLDDGGAYLSAISCKEHITQIYTKQGDNYVLVWDKESGVI